MTLEYIRESEWDKMIPDVVDQVSDQSINRSILIVSPWRFSRNRRPQSVNDIVYLVTIHSRSKSDCVILVETLFGYDTPRAAFKVAKKYSN